MVSCLSIVEKILKARFVSALNGMFCLTATCTGVMFLNTRLVALLMHSGPRNAASSRNLRNVMLLVMLLERVRLSPSLPPQDISTVYGQSLSGLHTLFIQTRKMYFNHMGLPIYDLVFWPSQ